MSVHWSEDLATGIERIDAQHRELYAQVSALHDAMRANQLDRVPGILEFLQGYALDHFALEEREMAAASYPGLPEHQRLHRSFVEDFLGHKASLSAGVTVSGVVDLSQWLTDWLRDHVRRVDGDMARHLRRPPAA